MYARALLVAVTLLGPAVFNAPPARAAEEGSPGLLSGLFEGTPEERRACVKDVARHCREAMPDNFRVLACLQQVRTKISKPCLAVLESHGQ